MSINFYRTKGSVWWHCKETRNLFPFNRNKEVITATQHSHNSWVMLELSAVRCQSKQCDGKYSCPVHPSQNTVVMSQLELGFPAADVWRGGGRAARSWCCFVPEQRFSLLTVTWLREMLSWEEPHCIRTKDVFNTSTHQLYRMCPVKAIVRIVLMCYISIHQSTYVSYYTMEKKIPDWCPLKL